MNFIWVRHPIQSQSVFLSQVFFLSSFSQLTFYGNSIAAESSRENCFGTHSTFSVPESSIIHSACGCRYHTRRRRCARLCVCSSFMHGVWAAASHSMHSTQTLSGHVLLGRSEAGDTLCVGYMSHVPMASGAGTCLCPSRYLIRRVAFQDSDSRHTHTARNEVLRVLAVTSNEVYGPCDMMSSRFQAIRAWL